MAGRNKSLKTSLYQLVISRLDGSRIGDPRYESRLISLVKKGIGGFILFGGQKDVVKEFIHRMQAEAETPLLIASDIERGVHQQVSGYTPFPCQMAVSGAVDMDRPDDVQLLSDAVRSVAEEAGETGINMPLIPVLDVNQDPDNPIICTRAFSDSPEMTSRFGEVYIRILEEARLLSCAKHFPGHGDTSMDSHIQLPVVQKSFKDLARIDLVPFRRAIGAGVSSVMAGHLVVSSIDRKPASLSEMLISGLLRKELGFEGLVLTDALNMHALKGISNVPAQSLKAGVDILLHPDDPDSTVEELEASLGAGEISADHIEMALSRITRAKERIWEKESGAIDWRRHGELSQRITAKSITLVKYTPKILPLSGIDNVSVVLAGDDKYFKSSLLRSCFRSQAHTGESRQSPGELSEETLVIAIFTSVAAWKGSSGIYELERQRINASLTRARRSVVVSFGSPYVLRHFKSASILVAAYEPTEQAQNAVIRCLLGELEFQGRLPVSLDFGSL
ncbi:MAG TPA: glycoside hydrolase family 3 N-terminal domain-containing protein [Thermodesulfovibrionales bacterium]|nr:glycoside hydrolase family 3 N-terminal domain-containing protein [Thermodesulfovibrionales bacterium]